MEDKPLTYTDACRACLNTNNDNKYPFTENNLDKMFEITTNITISQDDHLPKQVCLRCLELINTLYNFKLQCHISNATLIQHLSTDKSEVNNDSHDDIDNANSPNMEILKIEIDDEPSDDSKQNNVDENDDVEEDMSLDKLKLKTAKKRKSSNKREKTSESSMSVHYECGLCENTENKSFAELEVHLDIHKRDKLCNNCGVTFYDWAQLISHRYEHLTTNNLICHLCEKQIETDKKLRFHLKKHHFLFLEKTCDICNKTFGKRANYTRHMKYNHSDKKTIPCTTCGKLFKTLCQLKIHSKIHSSEKKYICEECGFCCNFRGGLSSHISRRHGPDQKLICHKCSKVFKSKESFAEHERMHNMVCICSQCGKEFNRPQLLKRHMMSHSGERPFPCGYCPARFRSASQLGNHERRHTGQRPFQCKFCPSSFFTQNVLIKHTRRHTGEKPYVCAICKKGFTGGYNLKVHMKVHGENLIISKNDK